MEFKKTTKTNRPQPQRSASRPIDPSFTTPRVHPTRSAPPIVTNPQPQIAPQQPRIETRIDLPKKDLSPPHLSLKEVIVSYIQHFRFTKKRIIICCIAASIAIAGIGVLFANQINIARNTESNNNPNEVLQELEYQTILPEGKSISDLGGWRRVSPVGSDPVYAYNDTIGSAAINVSQQPLPDSFIGDTDTEVAELAKKFNATNKIQAGDIKLYVGSSSKGPQSAIFTKNSLLVLIKSQVKIEDADWAKYVKSLS